MRERLQFWQTALGRGLVWLGWLGGIFSVLVGGSLVAALIVLANLPPPWSVAVVLAAFLILLAEGSYREWTEANREQASLIKAVRHYEASNSPTQDGIANLTKQGIELRRRVRTLTDENHLPMLWDKAAGKWTTNVLEMFENGKFLELKDEFYGYYERNGRYPGYDMSRDNLIAYLDGALALLVDMQERLSHSGQDALIPND
jgi:hypothetical protein